MGTFHCEPSLLPSYTHDLLPMPTAAATTTNYRRHHQLPPLLPTTATSTIGFYLPQLPSCNLRWKLKTLSGTHILNQCMCLKSLLMVRTFKTPPRSRRATLSTFMPPFYANHYHDSTFLDLIHSDQQHKAPTTLLGQSDTSILHGSAVSFSDTLATYALASNDESFENHNKIADRNGKPFS